MLHEFLQDNRAEILAMSEKNTKVLAGALVSSEKLRKGLPLFYEQLIKVLEENLLGQPQKDMLKTAASHGRESLHLGYSLSHVVHSYGSMCQAITELATTKNANISSNEFNTLNGCLDMAIASAVSEYQFRSNEAIDMREVKHLGFLAHELRNSLSSATVAQEMIRAGLVGVGGSTASVLEASLVRMQHLIDRSLSEVRMRSDSSLYISKFRLADLFDQIAITAAVEAQRRNQTLKVDVDWNIEVEMDRHFLLAAVANLIQNAIKYSKPGSAILLRGSLNSGRVTVEVQDECGGIAVDKLESIFAPYVQESTDRSGLGLGLTIARKAVDLNQGVISVKNNPGIGCTFVIETPQKITAPPSNKQTVPGVDSVQPDFKKKK